MNKEVISSKPKSLTTKKLISAVKIICPSPAKKETLPKSFIISGFKPIPTMNKRMVIPILENNST